VICVHTEKRRSTGAFQNAKREMCVKHAATFWSAALLRRFSMGSIKTRRVGSHYCVFAQPMTPHAMRAPESPEGCVFRSSGFACTTTERPIADFASFVREI
jgi:hypothetical protein